MGVWMKDVSIRFISVAGVETPCYPERNERPAGICYSALVDSSPLRLAQNDR